MPDISTAHTTSLPTTGAIVRACPDGTWRSWASTSSASSTTLLDGSTWGIWTGDCAATTTCTINYELSNGIWNQWVNCKAEVLTPEQIADRERRNQERLDRERERMRLVTIATQRAERLLEELLTSEQVEQYRKLKKFHVISESGQRYEVDCQRRQHNIYDLDSRGNRVVEHCIYQEGHLPLPDNIAAQILLLQTNEQEFRRIANQTRMRA